MLLLRHTEPSEIRMQTQASGTGQRHQKAVPPLKGQPALWKPTSKRSSKPAVQRGRPIWKSLVRHTGNSSPRSTVAKQQRSTKHDNNHNNGPGGPEMASSGSEFRIRSGISYNHLPTTPTTTQLIFSSSQQRSTTSPQGVKRTTLRISGMQ